jgi:hypothetical protein
LLAFLGDAQRRSAHEDAAEMKFLVRFIFDDHDFGPASQQLGLTLLDSAEVEAVANFVAALDAAIGPRQSPLSEITGDQWRPVSETAARARSCLVKQGESWFED